MYQGRLDLVPYEDGEHVMVLYSGGVLDDAWYRASDEQLVDRYGRIIGRPGTILHRRDKERRMNHVEGQGSGARR